MTVSSRQRNWREKLVELGQRRRSPADGTIVCGLGSIPPDIGAENYGAGGYHTVIIKNMADLTLCD